jgi:malate dehydrogenase (oxaloacetate-decarboxylating)(NADP+)
MKREKVRSIRPRREAPHGRGPGGQEPGDPAPAGRARGIDLLHEPLLNKGTAFTEEERDALGLRGLLPPRVLSQELQVTRVLENLRGKPTDLEKYIALASLQDRNETLFYRVVIDHLEEMMPLIYTPTVGEACRAYGHIFRRPRGLFVSADDRGSVRRVLRNWPRRDVRVVVVTDGERILGLGDLGANGMGIPVGKLALYTACAGIRPEWCLPVALDVGTETRALRDDPLYLGLPRRRLRGPAYDALLDEVLEAIAESFPRAVIQLEDFSTANAFRLLERYRDRYRLFDDDIQGTAAVVLAGLRSALRLTGGSLADQRVLFFGAGEAGLGSGRLIAAALERDGMSAPQARARCLFFDSRGLVVEGRPGLGDAKREFAHPGGPIRDLEEAVRVLRPTAMVGVSGVASTFTPAVLRAMASINERPIVFALSNPTSHSECTAVEAYRFTAGRVIFASGSPFGEVRLDGRTFVPGQSNNAYVFPGVGLGVIASGARRITDEMFLAAADTLALQVTGSDLDAGRIYPPLRNIRAVSARIAAAVAEVARGRGLATVSAAAAEPLAGIRAGMYEPVYRCCIDRARPEAARGVRAGAERRSRRASLP